MVGITSVFPPTRLESTAHVVRLQVTFSTSWPSTAAPCYEVCLAGMLSTRTVLVLRDPYLTHCRSRDG